MSASSEKTGNKVAIITGGSRGIGRRIAERLAQANYAVVINYRSETAKADEVVAGITKAGGVAKAVSGDVADETAMARLFETAEREFGGVDVVVHVAGILSVTPLADFDLKRMDEILRTNLRGTLVVNQQAARKVHSGGAIINISSAITNNLAPGHSVYAVTKAGLEALTKVLAKELGERNITVNTVAPTTLKTVVTANKCVKRLST
ncbi:MAG: 3-oxoacyl-(acyl-carrier-protein) reductase FabG [Syntrophorhabdus sp. PtaU1.Bin153]|nr:MAG: 3-oxoacyl-(acyl-carrier-protein) reductase FabG [Syntrophorhabdus sp. PtaU1.Bin153]